MLLTVSTPHPDYMTNPTKRDFPFQSVLSLKLLIEYWEAAIKSGAVPLGEPLLEQLQHASELREPITDLSVLERHRPLVNFLMTAVMAPAQSDKELAAATAPFRFVSFFESRGFTKNLNLAQMRKSAIVNIPGCDMAVGKTIQACLLILEQFYNVRLNFDKPILFTVPNAANGLDKVYRIEIVRQFCEIKATRSPRPIDPSIIKFLTEKVYDVDLWLQYIRPEDFEFHGFMVLRMVDVTAQEMVSSIKYDLLQKDAVSQKESFSAIQQKIRSIFGMPEIRLGLAYFDSDNNTIISAERDTDCWKSLIESGVGQLNCSSYQGSVYERSCLEKRYIAIEDLEAYPYKSPVEEALLANGVKSILLAPLIDGGEVIGMLELATPNAGEINPITANKVERVLPMFTAAVKRVKEEMITDVRAIIQEECTNIHPVVQWRFLDAGRRVLDKRRRGEPAVFEEITFHDVYPLFGMADIRNSSLARNAAIRNDLLHNLELVKALLEKIRVQRRLPALDEILFKIDSHLGRIGLGLGSGDESTLMDFLKTEIHPLLINFDDEEFHRDIQAYRSQLDPTFGQVYRERMAFEDSLSMINSMISNYLTEAQLPAQQMFPHYFEKYQTDGVEYTIYAGTSLTKDKQFNSFYLKNFRLWQLLISSEIEKRMEQLKPSLKTDLELTQLILVQSQPLSIRFRPDEKQFDVDGAYDIRYEIVKKRIDKATVKTTGERLTQPGKIAIIYSQPNVKDEYKGYLRYLASKDILGSEIEELELEELPGVNGLKALRVQVLPSQKSDTTHKDDLIHRLELALELH